MKIKISLFLVLASHLSCARPTSGGHSIPKIFGGEPVVDTELREVVGIVDDDQDIFCTGTLVTDRLVLTAAHCLRGKIPFSEKLKVYFGSGNDSRRVAEEDLHLVESGLMHPKYVSGRTSSADFDVAYLVLKDPVTDVKPAQILSDFHEVSSYENANTKVLLVGFGCRDGKFPCTGGSKYKAEVSVNVRERLRMDLGQNLSKGASNGDSGGPAFAVLPDGSRRLLGNTSEKGLVGAWYTTTRNIMCWAERNSGVSIPDAALHCYEDLQGVKQKQATSWNALCENPDTKILKKSFELLRDSIGAKSCAEISDAFQGVKNRHLKIDKAVAFDLRALPPSAKNLETLTLPDTFEANWQLLSAFPAIKKLMIHWERVDVDSVLNTAEISPSIQLSSTHLDSDAHGALIKKNTRLFAALVPQLENIDKAVGSSRTLLHEAVWSEQLDMIKILLAAGANLDARETNYLRTPLHYALMLSYTNVVKVLLDGGASCTIKDKSGTTVADYAKSLPRTTELRVLLEARCPKS